MKKSKRRKKDSFLGAPNLNFVPVVNSESSQAPKGKRVSKSFIVGAIVVGVIILAAGGFYLFAITRDDAPIPNTANLELAQVQKLIDNVSELIDIPKGEAPIMAIVSDATNLKSQAFFKNAQNGDRVMIFKSTKQAVLYRASTNKIIAATFVTDQEIESFQKLTQGENNQNATPSAETNEPSIEVSSKPKVVVLNGTKESGLAKKAGELLDEEKFDVVGTGNTQGDYDKTIIVNITNSQPSSKLNEIISQYSKVKATIAKLPSSEAAPAGAEIVIILGKDFSESY